MAGKALAAELNPQADKRDCRKLAKRAAMCHRVALVQFSAQFKGRRTVAQELVDSNLTVNPADSPLSTAAGARSPAAPGTSPSCPCTKFHIVHRIRRRAPGTNLH